MSEYFTAEQTLQRSKANQMYRGGTSITGMYAGELISGATLPVAVYQNTSDNEFYACDGNDLNKLQFQGFAISDANDGEEIDIQFEGIVKGFSGLSEGVRYYVQDDKTIGTTPGTYTIQVGIAISETELLIVKSEGIRITYTAGTTLQHSNDTEKNTSSITYVKKKEILLNENLPKLGNGEIGTTIQISFELKTNDIAGTAYGRIYKNGVAIGTERSWNSDTNYQTYTENLGPFVSGDLIQIYIRNSDGTKITYTRNFRFYFKKSITNIGRVSLTTELPISAFDTSPTNQDP